MATRKPAAKRAAVRASTTETSTLAAGSTPTPAKRGRPAKAHRGGSQVPKKLKVGLESGNHGKFAIYIARVVKDMNKSGAAEASGKGSEFVPLKLGRRSMAILNAFAVDMADRLQSAAIEAAHRSGKKTTGLAESVLATKWLLGDIGSGELSKFALAEGTKAIVNYNSSYGITASK